MITKSGGTGRGGSFIRGVLRRRSSVSRRNRDAGREEVHRENRDVNGRVDDRRGDGRADGNLNDVDRGRQADVEGGALGNNNNVGRDNRGVNNNNNIRDLNERIRDLEVRDRNREVRRRNNDSSSSSDSSTVRSSSSRSTIVDRRPQLRPEDFQVHPDGDSSPITRA